MPTNSTDFTTERIRAIASLWPLALVVLVIILMFVVVRFFLPQTRNFLNRLSGLKAFGTELKLDQVATAPLQTEPESSRQDATANVQSVEAKDNLTVKPNDQPDLPLDPYEEMYVHLATGKLEEAEALFKQLLLKIDDPEKRFHAEAVYLKDRFESGDVAAQDRLHELEKRAKAANSRWMGFIIRTDGECYLFSRNYLKAIERFHSSAEGCLSDEGRAESFKLAASCLMELQKAEDAITLLTKAINGVSDSDAKVVLWNALGSIYEKKKEHFTSALAFQRALSYQPNSTDLLFKTGYAWGNAEYNELSVYHYRKLLSIDPTHKAALNNIGVAYGRLGMPSLAVANYKRGIQYGDTLSVSNLAYILIDAGVLDEAEKVLKEAESKNDVHQNVHSALVRVEEIKEETKESLAQNLSFAGGQYQFLLGFCDATFAVNSAKINLAGKWVLDSGGTECEKVESGTLGLEVIWTDAINTKYRFVGKIDGLASRGKVEKWMVHAFGISNIFGEEPKESFQPYGEAYLAVSPGFKAISMFVQESNSKNYRLLSFIKSAS